jgi:branched-chain amino acid aminotransferase
LERLYEGARALRIDLAVPPAALARSLFECLAANKMENGVHIRLMVTRGIKKTPYQNPRVTTGPATIVIIPEYKMPRPEIAQRGLRLFTFMCAEEDPINRTRKSIPTPISLACIQAAEADADEALMFDARGHIATCNSTHFFIIRRGEIWTSTGMCCLAGISRANVLRIARRANFPAFEKDLSLVDVYGADEAFVTGTLAGLTPVVEVNARILGHPTKPAEARQMVAQRITDAARPLYDRLTRHRLRLFGQPSKPNLARTQRDGG